MRVLILKPSSLGDVIQALPVLRLIKRQFPASEAWWWVDTRFAALLEGDRDLAGIVRFERQRWGRLRHWPEMLASIRWLRTQRFDWVIDLQGLARSGAFAWLANGRLLAGLEERREGAHGLYDIIVPRASSHTHAVDWYLSLLPRLGVRVDRNFDWLPVRQAVADAVRAKWQPSGAPRVALLPGARWENKRWPLEHFQALVEAVAAARPDVEFIVLGGKDDAAAGQALSSTRPGQVRDLAGQTSLPEVIEWLRLCQVVISNDTGPMHAAAALGKEVIGLFGPTEPRRTGPYGQTKNVLQNRALPCVPCMKAKCAWHSPLECLRSLSPSLAAERVLAALRS